MAHAAQTRIDHFERVVGVVAAEGKRGSHLEDIAVAAHESHQNAFSADRADDVLRLRGVQRLTTLAIANQIDPPKEPGASHIADDRMLIREFREAPLEVPTDFMGVLEQA